MTMTRDERIAHANEIFDMVWGDEGKRESYDTLDVAVCDLLCAADDLKTIAGDLKHPEKLEDAEYDLLAYSKELRLLAERLQEIEFDGVTQ